MKSLTASIFVELALGEEVYNVNLELPSAVPTASKPFKFKVISKPKNSSDGVIPDILLNVAVGSSEHIYVAVKPPKSLLEAVKVGDVVQKIQVVVSEGHYDTDNGTFSAHNAIENKENKGNKDSDTP